jgi:hypothetical protein
MKLTLELIDQIAPDPGPEPLCIGWDSNALEKHEVWKSAASRRRFALGEYEKQRIEDILMGKEVPFPCNTLIK